MGAVERSQLNSSASGGPVRALHDQVADELHGLISELEHGTRLPSEAELVERFGVSRTTVRRAIKALAESGVLNVQHGRGTFVAASPVVQSMDDFQPFVDSLIADGHRSASLIDAGWQTGWDVPAAIGGPDLPAFAFRWLHEIDGRPHALFECALPLDVGRLVDREMVERTPVYYLLKDELGLTPHSAEFTFSAELASKAVGSLLQVRAGSPVLLLHRTTFDQSKNILECGQYHLAPEMHRIRLTANARSLASVVDFGSKSNRSRSAT